MEEEAAAAQIWLPRVSPALHSSSVEEREADYLSNLEISCLQSRKASHRSRVVQPNRHDSPVIIFPSEGKPWQRGVYLSSAWVSQNDRPYRGQQWNKGLWLPSLTSQSLATPAEFRLGGGGCRIPGSASQACLAQRRPGVEYLDAAFGVWLPRVLLNPAEESCGRGAWSILHLAPQSL